MNICKTKISFFVAISIFSVPIFSQNFTEKLWKIKNNTIKINTTTTELFNLESSNNTFDLSLISYNFQQGGTYSGTSVTGRVISGSWSFQGQSNSITIDGKTASYEFLSDTEFIVRTNFAFLDPNTMTTDAESVLHFYSLEDICNQNILNINQLAINSGIYNGKRITSVGEIVPNSNVTYKAEQDVILNAGFHAKVGGSFLATIEDCEDDLTPSQNIIIDGNFDDWVAIPNSTTNGSAGLNFLKTYDDCEFIYIYVNGNFDAHFQLYIDSDFNSTGSNEFMRHYPNTGMNFMIEDAYPYEYTGTGLNWSWNQISLEKESFEVNNNELEIRVPKSLIPNLSSSIHIGFVILDSEWEVSGKLPNSDTGVTYLSNMCTSFIGNESYSKAKEREKNSFPTKLNKEVSFNVFPNPFNQTLTVAFNVKKDAIYNLNIYDVLGKLVTQPVKGEQLKKGYYEVKVNVNVVSNIFVVQLSNDIQLSTKKVIAQIRK